MGLIRDFFFGAKTVAIGDINCDPLTAEICLYELALENVTSIIGNALVQTKILTYENGKNIKGDMYHLFNVKPNLNENAAEFKKKLATKLVFDNEALVIQSEEGYLFIADVWDVNDSVFYPKIYYNIVIDGFQMTGSRNATQVLHLKLNNKDVTNTLQCVYSMYGKAIKRAFNQFYKLRGIFKLQNFVGYQDKQQEEIADIFKKKVTDYFGDSNTSVMTLEKGLEFEDKSKNEVKADDIDSMIDRVFNIVFSSFGIPIGLMREGAASTAAKSTSANMDQLLAMCINPLTSLLENEANAKFYSRSEYLSGNFVRLRTYNVKHNSPLESATNIDVLRRNGFNFNEIMNYLGEEEIDEAWAYERFITKNYERIKKEGSTVNEA